MINFKKDSPFCYACLLPHDNLSLQNRKVYYLLLLIYSRTECLDVLLCHGFSFVVILTPETQTKDLGKHEQPLRYSESKKKHFPLQVFLDALLVMASNYRLINCGFYFRGWAISWKILMQSSFVYFFLLLLVNFSFLFQQNLC